MRQTISATIWTAFDKIWGQGIQFVLGIVLARLLSPEDYGLIGLCSIFITFSSVIADAGFSNALIRKLDRNQLDYSTAFIFNATVGFFLYWILFFVSPFISAYFDAPVLKELIRIVGLTIFVNSLCIVQNAILTASMRMKVQMYINIAAQVPSGIVAIIMAYHGFGVYSLAIQSVGNSVLRLLFFSLAAKWHPSFEFSKESMRYLWGFGSKLIGANCLGVVFNEIYSFIIGKSVGKAELGYFNKGQSLARNSDSICQGVIQKVAIPIMSLYQNNKEILKTKYRELTKIVACIMTWISAMLVACAQPLIVILWGEKWIESVWIFQAHIIGNLICYVGYLTLILLQVVNHTEYTLKLEFIKKPIALIAILALLKYGIKGLVGALLIKMVAETLINLSAPKKYIGYQYKDQFKDVVIYMFAAAISLSVVYLSSLLPINNNWIVMLLRLFLVTSSYFMIMWISRDEITFKYGSLLIQSLKRKYDNK